MHDRPFYPFEVLVIDDEPLVREIMIGNLAEKFPTFLFKEAEGGNQGLTYLDSRVPDLILLDLRMPGLNGFAFLRLIRNRDRTRRTPVIVVSGLNDFSSVRKALELGANDYCLKPIDFSQLARKIEHLCHNVLGRKDIQSNSRSAPRRPLVARTGTLMPVFYPEKEGIWVNSPIEVMPGEPILYDGSHFLQALRLQTESSYQLAWVDFCYREKDWYKLKLLFDSVPPKYEEQLSLLSKSRFRFKQLFTNGVHIEVPCEILDVSGEGLKILGSLPWQVGSDIQLNLDFMLRKIGINLSNSSVTATIQWCQPQTSGQLAGVHLKQIDDELKDQIMRWCLEGKGKRRT